MIKFSLFLHMDMIIIGVRLKFEFLTKITKTLFIPDFPSISPEFLSWWYLWIFLKMFSIVLEFLFYWLIKFKNCRASASNFNFVYKKTKQSSTPSDDVFWLAKQISIYYVYKSFFTIWTWTKPSLTKQTSEKSKSFYEIQRNSLVFRWNIA